jgi:hypothetical protein
MMGKLFNHMKNLKFILGSSTSTLAQQQAFHFG